MWLASTLLFVFSLYFTWAVSKARATGKDAAGYPSAGLAIPAPVVVLPKLEGPGDGHRPERVVLASAQSNELLRLPYSNPSMLDGAGDDGSPDVTLVTQCTVSRAWMLPLLCERWQGRAVVALLMPKAAKSVSGVLPLPLDARRKLADAKCRHIKVHPVLPLEDEDEAERFPINRLRNEAVAAANTSHFFLTDVDMMPDEGLYEALKTLLRQRDSPFVDAVGGGVHSAAVVAAFSKSRFCSSEKECLEEAEAAPRSRHELRECLRDSKCTQFDENNLVGQETAVQLWLRATRLTRVPCFRSHRFEPYLMVQKSALLPRFDERFKGYGKNKIQWVLHLQYSDFNFYVVPTHFLVHVPHPPSGAKEVWRHSALRKQMDNLYSSFARSITARKSKLATPYCTSARRKSGGGGGVDKGKAQETAQETERAVQKRKEEGGLAPS